MMRTLPLPAGRSILVTDFDGTMTRRDFFWLTTEKLLPPGTPDYWGQYRAGKITHFQALQGIFGSIRADESELVRLLDEMELDPQTPQALERLRLAGWEVVVASAGCGWYIDQLLAKAGVRVAVYSNPGRFVAGQGLVMSPPHDSPFFSPTLGIDKAAIVRSAVDAGRRVAFAGDGYPDIDAARLVEARYRFAKDALAESLAQARLSYIRFERWSEIAGALLEEGCNV